MNLKSFLFLSSAFMSSDVLAQGQEERKLKNENCAISGDISCKVINDGTDCRDLNIRLDQCKKIKVLMDYKFCNNEPLEQDQIVIIPSLSYTNIYESFKERLSFTSVPASQCISEVKERVVDTCTRNRVNADMKLEGWKTFSENFGNYCHVYRHYFPRINKYTIGPSPSPLPAPQFIVRTLCFLERVKGDREFTVPCEELGLDYFLESFKRNLSGGRTDENEIDFERGLKYQFVIESLASESVLVDEIITTIDGERYVVATRSDGITVAAGQELLVGEFTKDVDFANYSDGDFTIDSSITATGLKSGTATAETVIDVFSIPEIEFRWRVNDVKCTIEGSNQYCANYIAALPSLDNAALCEVNVEYAYEVENIGEKCEEINRVTTIVDGKSVNLALSDWNFCPTDVETVVEVRKDNLCSYAGREIELITTLNGETGDPTASFVGFPEPSDASPMLAIDSFRCEIHGSDPKMNCDDYIKDLIQNKLPCQTDVMYRAKLLNVGDACMYINDMELNVGGTIFQIHTKNWLFEKKNFCQGDSLNIQKKAVSTDLCDIAGTEVDVEVTVNGQDAATPVPINAFSSIVFPVPNSATAPQAPPSGPCTTKPNSLTIKLNRETCDTSSNSQGVTGGERKVTRYLKHRKNYPDSSPRDCECQQCTDHKYGDIHAFVIPTVMFSKKHTDGTTMKITEVDIDFNTEYVFTPDEMPDCLQIDIEGGDSKNGKYKYKNHKVQTTGFDVCSSSGATLNVGDTFGAVEIVRID